MIAARYASRILTIGLAILVLLLSTRVEAAVPSRKALNLLDAKYQWSQSPTWLSEAQTEPEVVADAAAEQNEILNVAANKITQGIVSANRNVDRRGTVDLNVLIANQFDDELMTDDAYWQYYTDCDKWDVSFGRANSSSTVEAKTNQPVVSTLTAIWAEKISDAGDFLRYCEFVVCERSGEIQQQLAKWESIANPMVSNEPTDSADGLQATEQSQNSTLLKLAGFELQRLRCLHGQFDLGVSLDSLLNEWSSSSEILRTAQQQWQYWFWHPYLETELPESDIDLY